MKKEDKIKIIIKPDYITWEEITEVIHQAFIEKKEKGMNYLGSYQTVEITKKRVGDGICLVALLNKKVVGTMTVKFFKPTRKGKKWHNETMYAYASQDAVLPEYKGLGIGRKLQNKRIEICQENNVDELLMHTSTYAQDILNWWKRQGAQKIELISGTATNYYSIRMRLPICGRKFNKYYVAYKYYLSVIKCRLTKDKYGKERSFFN